MLKLNITLMDFNLLNDDLKIITDTMERNKTPVTDEEMMNILKTWVKQSLIKLIHLLKIVFL